MSSCPGDADHDGRAAERRDVAGGVAGAARHDLGRVVVEDQHRRFARHARDLAVDELVGDQVAEHGRPRAGEAVDELEQAARIDRRRVGDLRIRTRAESRRRRRSGCRQRRPAVTPAFGEASSVRPYPVRTSTPRAPTACPASRSCQRSPTTNERARSMPSSEAARVNMPGCGLRQSQTCRYASTTPPDDAGSSRSASMRAPPAASRSVMCWCASATNDSLKIPRAMPAWLVTIDHRESRCGSAAGRRRRCTERTPAARADRDSRPPR